MHRTAVTIAPLDGAMKVVLVVVLVQFIQLVAVFLLGLMRSFAPPSTSLAQRKSQQQQCGCERALSVVGNLAKRAWMILTKVSTTIFSLVRLSGFSCGHGAKADRRKSMQVEPAACYASRPCTTAGAPYSAARAPFLGPWRGRRRSYAGRACTPSSQASRGAPASTTRPCASCWRAEIRRRLPQERGVRRCWGNQTAIPVPYWLVSLLMWFFKSSLRWLISDSLRFSLLTVSSGSANSTRSDGFCRSTPHWTG